MAKQAVLTARTETVLCGHEDPTQGKGVVAAEGATKLTVNALGVLLAGGIENKTITGCPTPSSSTSSACQKSVGVTAGKATKLTVAGQAVVLETLAGTTDGVIGGALQTLLHGKAQQSRLTSV